MGKTVLGKYRIMNRLLCRQLKKVLKYNFTIRNGAQLVAYILAMYTRIYTSSSECLHLPKLHLCRSAMAWLVHIHAICAEAVCLTNSSVTAYVLAVASSCTYSAEAAASVADRFRQDLNKLSC